MFGVNVVVITVYEFTSRELNWWASMVIVTPCKSGLGFRFSTIPSIGNRFPSEVNICQLSGETLALSKFGFWVPLIFNAKVVFVSHFPSVGLTSALHQPTMTNE